VDARRQIDIGYNRIKRLLRDEFTGSSAIQLFVLPDGTKGVRSEGLGGCVADPGYTRLRRNGESY
jgi:hypothetical protein